MVKTTIVKTQAELDAALVGHTADSGDVICIKGGTTETPIKLDKYYGWTIHAAGNAVVEVSHGAYIRAMGKSTVFLDFSEDELNEYSAVAADDRARIYAYGHSHVWASKNTYVDAFDYATVIATGNSTVYAYIENTVDATQKSKVFAYEKSTVYQYDDAKVYQYDDSVVIDRRKEKV